MDLSEKKVFVFDFDGTLVDSNKIKKDAFFLLRDDPAFIDSLTKAHSKMPEVSRYILLREVLTNISHKDIDQELNKLAQKYGELVEEKTIKCPEMPGAEKLLKVLKERKIVLYLSSNTPEDSLNRIISAKKWNTYFKGIFGSPKEKSDTIKIIYDTEGLGSPSEIIVLGDGTSDKNSAEAINCDFIDVNSTKLQNILEELNCV